MGRDIPPIAGIRLARSLPRLLAWPAVLLALGAAAAVAGALAGGIGGLVLLAAAGLLGLLAVAWAVRVLSVRLDIEESEIRVRWFGGERRYVLSAGPVTRVRFRGENASRLRVRSGILGYGLGPARLRDDEEIHVVRLAPTPTAILVPTEEGRLAIAPSNESELLEALSRAARARQRLDDLAQAVETHEPDAAGVTTDEPEPAFAEQPPATPVSPVAPVEPADAEPDARPMTGIERMLYERRLAEERAAAEAAAEAALAALARAEQEAADAPKEAAMPAPAASAAIPAAVATTVPEGAARPRRMPTLRIGRAQARHAVALVPLVGALAAWGIGIVGDRIPDPATDLGRLTALGLVLAGPATAIGVIVARTWWPRLIGVVVVGGLATSALIGRVLIGG